MEPVTKTSITRQSEFNSLEEALSWASSWDYDQKYSGLFVTSVHIYRRPSNMYSVTVHMTDDYNYGVEIDWS